MIEQRENYGAFLLRVAFGAVLIAHGALKVFVFTLPGTASYFESIGLPGFTAYLVAFGEILGGIALISGFLTRLAAALSIPIMLGATWVHLGNGWVFSNKGGGWEFPLLLVVIAIVITLQGPGAYAIKKVPFLK